VEVPPEAGGGEQRPAVEAEECDEEEVVGGWVIYCQLGRVVFSTTSCRSLLHRFFFLLSPFMVMYVPLYILRLFGFFVVIHLTLVFHMRIADGSRICRALHWISTNEDTKYLTLRSQL
jgi:hypothetical protein